MHSTIKVCIFLMLSVLLAACTSGGSGAKVTPTLVPTPVTVRKPTYLVQRGEVVRTAQLNGRVTPVLQQELFFRSDGFVKEVLVKSGDTVGEGDVLARLDEPERYQADAAAAELALAQAQLKLEQVQLDSPVKLAEAKIALAQARLDLDKAQKALEALSYPRVTDPLTLEKYRAEAAAAQKNLEDAQDHYDSLSGLPETDPARGDALNTLIAARTAFYRAAANLNWAEGEAAPADFELAQLNLELAQAACDKAAAEVEHWESEGPTSDTNLTRLSLADAEARLALAKKAQGAVELRAPFTGQVLSLGIAPGSSVTAFQAVLTLADPSELEIRAVPSAEDLNLLGIGQVALVRLSSRQGEQLTAKISSLPLVVSAAGSSGQDSSVHFVLEDESVSLSLGNAATLLVTIDTRQDVLWLPPAAIRSFQGESFVFIEASGVQRRVNITLGLKSAERVEILSGLEEGQTVIGQ